MSLIEFIKRSSDDVIKSSLLEVKNAKIGPSRVGGDWIDIGPWALKERKVSMFLGGPPGVAPYWLYEGNLERSPDGTWQLTNVRGGYTSVPSLPMPPPAPPMAPRPGS